MICTSLGKTGYESALEKTRSEGLVELRLDLLDFNSNQIKTLISQKARIIATYRPGKADDKVRLEALKEAVSAGAGFVDIEWDAEDEFLYELVPFARGNDCRVIISFVDKEKTPVKRELEHIVKECSMKGADIVKILCRVNNSEDNARILSLYSLGKNIIAIGLGNLGKITRLAAPLIGAEFTYASPDKGPEKEEEKMSRAVMERTYKILGYELKPV